MIKHPFCLHRIFLSSLLILIVAVPWAAAHDFWIQPSNFSPEKNELLEVNLLLGPPLQGEAYPRDSKHIIQFFITDTKEENSVLGIEGKTPAGYLRLQKSGTYLMAYHGTPQENTLDSVEFEKYLKHSGLEKIILMRERKKETDQPGREIFSRCAKSLLNVSGEHSLNIDIKRFLKLPLEIIPQVNPYLLQPGDSFSLQILYKGRPLSGALIAFANESISEEIEVRSDKHGKARVVLPQKGVWLVTAVHMVPARRKANVDWESYWTSLTFEIAEFEK